MGLEQRLQSAYRLAPAWLANGQMYHPNVKVSEKSNHMHYTGCVCHTSGYVCMLLQNVVRHYEPWITLVWNHLFILAWREPLWQCAVIRDTASEMETTTRTWNVLIACNGKTTATVWVSNLLEVLTSNEKKFALWQDRCLVGSTSNIGWESGPVL